MRILILSCNTGEGHNAAGKATGQAVKKGETILVFEAMKMENSVVAPEDGTVANIAVAIGDSFEAGATLASLN